MRNVISKRCGIDIHLAISISFRHRLDVETNLISRWVWSLISDFGVSNHNDVTLTKIVTNIVKMISL